MIAPVSSPIVQCICGETLANAQYVVHALDCHKVKEATAATRHKMVKEVFTRILKKYGFCPDLHEPRFSDGKGPDVCFAMGSKLCVVDVTICNPLAPSYVEAELKTPGKTLESTEAKKGEVHGDMAASRNVSFFPLAFTVFGVAGKEKMLFLKRIARTTSDRYGFVRHVVMAIGIAIQKGNSAILTSAVQHWRAAGIRA